MGTYVLNLNSSDIYTEYVKDGAYPDVNVLYKYRDWKNPYHRKLLEEPVIFMASPSSFKDKFDCHVPEEFPDIEELRALFLEKSFQKLPLNTSFQVRKAWVDYWCKRTPLANKQARDALAAIFYKEFCDIFGVLSLTANPSNDAMWDEYGANHTGFCVGYRKNIIEEFVGGAGPVVYTDDLPHVKYFKDDAMTQHVKNVFFKETKWDFEQEYRAHKIWRHKATLKDRNISIPVEAICEIIVGREIDAEDYDAIKVIAETKYPHATFKKEQSPRFVSW